MAPLDGAGDQRGAGAVEGGHRHVPSAAFTRKPKQAFGPPCVLIVQGSHHRYETRHGPHGPPIGGYAPDP